MAVAKIYAAENLTRLPLLTDVYSSLEATLFACIVAFCCAPQEPVFSFAFVGNHTHTLSYLGCAGDC